MKGFGIEIKNDLLEAKHVDSMGQAVWLYMWLIDHMTSINEDGVGLILGGKPIKYLEISRELGISQDTYTRWIDKLLEYPYIIITRASYGIVFKVLKAKKRFRTNAVVIPHERGRRFRTNAERTITYPVDYTKTMSSKKEIQRKELSSEEGLRRIADIRKRFHVKKM